MDSSLRTAAQQALEALQNCANGEDDVLLTRDALAALRAALAEPVQEPVYTDLLRLVGILFERAYEAGKAAAAEPKQDGCDHCNSPLYVAIKCRVCGRVTEPVQEPPCATQECMPSQCPNCASLEAQNTELDRKLADLEQTSLELCETCGWRTLIPGDCCLNCARKPLNDFDALRLITSTVGLLQSAGPVEGMVGIIRAVERAHGIGGEE